MEVLLANEYGFCFGVERAVEMVEDALSGGGPVRTLGPLIHNTQEMQRLECEGVSTVQDPSQVSKNEIAVIRAQLLSFFVFRSTKKCSDKQVSNLLVRE